MKKNKTQTVVLIMDIPAPKTKYNWRKHLKPKAKMEGPQPVKSSKVHNKSYEFFTEYIYAEMNFKTSIAEIAERKDGKVTLEEINYCFEKSFRNYEYCTSGIKRGLV
jgi:hypothetical protein